MSEKERLKLIHEIGRCLYECGNTKSVEYVEATLQAILVVADYKDKEDDDG